MANLAVTRAALALSDERTRKGAGWALVCVLSPLILLAALLCSLGSGASSHNVSVVEWCFHGGALPPGIPEEYAAHMMENPADFYYGVLWNKLYRRELVEAHHLRMDPDISWCEDFMFNLEYIRPPGARLLLRENQGLPLHPGAQHLQDHR